MRGHKFAAALTPRTRLVRSVDLLRKSGEHLLKQEVFHGTRNQVYDGVQARDGAPGAKQWPAGSRREMHRTDTVDYGIVLAGEVYLLLEREETLLRTGDVVVQVGTNHAWHNRSGGVARMAFVNVSGQVTDAQRCPEV